MLHRCSHWCFFSWHHSYPWRGLHSTRSPEGIDRGQPLFSAPLVTRVLYATDRTPANSDWQRPKIRLSWMACHTPAHHWMSECTVSANSKTQPGAGYHSPGFKIYSTSPILHFPLNKNLTLTPPKNLRLFCSLVGFVSPISLFCALGPAWVWARVNSI